MAMLTDDDQRQMFGDLAERRLATFTTQVERHAAAERQRWYDQASDGRIAQMQADARLHWSDDAASRIGKHERLLLRPSQQVEWHAVTIETFDCGFPYEWRTPPRDKRRKAKGA